MNNSLPLLLTALLLTAATSLSAATDDEQLVFADEFDLPDGSQPDPERWGVSARGHSTWNRWVSASSDVAFVRNGRLVCRAIPNPGMEADEVPMLTGAVETRNKFSFTYGRVEVRLRTNLHAGNFPAAWMMPQPPCDSWPNAGEIDIFESIDNQNIAYHTLHSHWTYDLGHKTDPVSSFTTSTNVRGWHVYGLEWTENQIIWTVDGRVAGTYNRSADSAVLAQGQWPFSHPFYLILNQSVGNGSWAREADTSFTYETEFDWVRVYQRIPDGILDTQSADAPSITFDLGGRPVPSRTASLPAGVYIRNGRKFVVR